MQAAWQGDARDGRGHQTYTGSCVAQVNSLPGYVFWLLVDTSITFQFIATSGSGYCFWSCDRHGLQPGGVLRGLMLHNVALVLGNTCNGFIIDAAVTATYGSGVTVGARGWGSDGQRRYVTFST